MIKFYIYDGTTLVILIILVMDSMINMYTFEIRIRAIDIYPLTLQVLFNVTLGNCAYVVVLINFFITLCVNSLIIMR